MTNSISSTLIDLRWLKPWLGTPHNFCQLLYFDWDQTTHLYLCLCPLEEDLHIPLQMKLHLFLPINESLVLDHPIHVKYCVKFHHSFSTVKIVARIHYKITIVISLRHSPVVRTLGGVDTTRTYPKLSTGTPILSTNVLEMRMYAYYQNQTKQLRGLNGWEVYL